MQDLGVPPYTGCRPPGWLYRLGGAEPLGAWKQQWPRDGGTDSHITARGEAGVRPHNAPGPLRPGAAVVHGGHREDRVLSQATPPVTPARVVVAGETGENTWGQ